MTHYTLCIPVTYEEAGADKTSFRRVGALFQNARKETGEVFYSISPAETARLMRVSSFEQGIRINNCLRLSIKVCRKAIQEDPRAMMEIIYVCDPLTH